MTVDSTVNRIDHDPNGTTTTFAYNFRVDQSGDLAVYADGVLLTSGYTVSGLGSPLGGNVTFATAPAASVAVLTFIRVLPLTQQTAYPAFGPFPAASHEAALDKLTFLIQQVTEQQDRALMADIGADPALVLEVPGYSAGAIWMWDQISKRVTTMPLASVLTPGVPVGSVLDLTALRAKTGYSGESVYLLYRTTLGDGGDGMFVWNADSVAADNGGTIIQVTGIAIGRWIRQYAGPIHARWFGLKADLVNDDSVAINAAINAADPLHSSEVVIDLYPGDAGVRIENTIAMKKFVTLRGNNTSGDRARSSNNKIEWHGAAGGTMISFPNILRARLYGISLDGMDVANYGVYVQADTAGWGTNNFEYLTIRGCERNSLIFKGTTSAIDGGRNNFRRCSFWTSHAATGTPEYDSTVAYITNSNVGDNYENCDFFYQSSAGAKIADTYAMYFSASSARIYTNECYSNSTYGMYVDSGASPSFHLKSHYSEDTNFVVMEAAANVSQTLIDCDHVLAGGISLQLKSGNGRSITIQGGSYDGTVDIANTNSGVYIGGGVAFDGGPPTISEPHRVITEGRSPGAAGISSGALSGLSFIPVTRSAQTSVTATANVVLGEVFPIGPLTGNTSITAPTNVNTTLDIGRVIEYQITGHATTIYTVTFNGIHKLAGGAYTHSGVGKTDVICFRYNGSVWIERYRSMNITL